MEKAINVATKGGYHWFGTKGKAEMLLDPLFWQALGKAEEWSESGTGLWRYEWHAFIDHIISGKPIDEFFNNLLKN